MIPPKHSQTFFNEDGAAGLIRLAFIDAMDYEAIDALVCRLSENEVQIAERGKRGVAWTSVLDDARGRFVRHVKVLDDCF